MDNTPIDNEPTRGNRFLRWLKRVGWLGFFFFLGKGIIWILVFLGAGKFFSTLFS